MQKKQQLALHIAEKSKASETNKRPNNFTTLITVLFQ